MSADRTDELIDSYKLATGANQVGLSLWGRPVAASDQTSADFDASQFVCGQGPSLDAQRTSQSIEVRDTAIEAEQWTVLTGAHGTWPSPSLLAVPIGAGPAVGALTFHRSRRGALAPNQHETAIACANHAAAWLLVSLDALSPIDLGHFDDVSCATGIVMAQTGLESDDATAVIRAHAYSANLGLAEVLHDIIHHQLTLT